MARAKKQKKSELDDLVRYIPKGYARKAADLDIYEINRLELVQASKESAPVRNEKRKDRDGAPTFDRLDKTAGFHVVGNDQQGGRTYTMQDSPLERLWARQRIDPVEYSALQRYRVHWYHAGLQGAVGSVDLNRVFASDCTNMSGMAKSEKQAHHRQQWRAAREMIGHRPGIIVDNIVCAEQSLEIAGYSIGYESPYRAREAAREILRDAGYRLSRFWGIG